MTLVSVILLKHVRVLHRGPRANRRAMLLQYPLTIRILLRRYRQLRPREPNRRLHLPLPRHVAILLGRVNILVRILRVQTAQDVRCRCSLIQAVLRSTGPSLSHIDALWLGKVQLLKRPSE